MGHNSTIDILIIIRCVPGQAKIIDGQIHFKGLISKPDGSDMIRVERVGPVSAAVDIGKEAGQEIRSIAGPRFAEYGAAVAAQQAASNSAPKV